MRKQSFTKLLLQQGKRVIALLLSFAAIYAYLSLGGYQIGTNLITGDWIPYSSKQYCYSLEYPGRWKLHISGDEGWHGGIRPFQRAMVSQPKPYIFGGTIFRVEQVSISQPTLEKLAAWSLANQDEKETIISTLESYSVAGEPALTRTLTGSSSVKTEIYIVRETDGLVLSMSTKARFHEDTLKAFQQIVETFTYQDCLFRKAQSTRINFPRHLSFIKTAVNPAIIPSNSH